ncbi:conserved exported hypothetical protein [Flavobacterium psychrophilum]|uniref:hypothetical protein n=1 Tax=Flavobacterium psychrophilum TaxID=96345 RepID=UPI000743CEE6|nr:hypothetical protein [Flavobacterium psychrophilum]EKT3957477.1 hypothetical protein [Flavobacterium psychrophilum]ELM3643337.1 hypothetical protein [Flavobacterium psychrophilum]KUM21710.1 hypothetical protein AS885_00210 [Flavobacterium psychrophilum]SNB13948.1 conserved exported hypothetical protein [Flavobacterium psychrophilum]SNB15748.1 conserved exported hypothetical protein [Flavobacterium psychrophilum]
MRNLIIYLTVFLCSIASSLQAQESFEARAKAIATNIEKITKEEKEALKKQVEEVNVALGKNSITQQQADEKKMQLATTSANNIESRIAVEESKLSELVKEKVEGNVGNVDTTRVFGRVLSISILDKEKKKKYKNESSEKRTTSQIVIATGFNNLVTNGRIANSDFGYLRSEFLEWGYTHNTRLLESNNLLHLKYGFSFMYNTLTPTNNRSFEVNGDQTNLVTNQFKLRKNDSYFKNVFITIPLHLEFDFSKSKTINDKVFFRSHRGFRLGIGGFVGYNTNAKQFLSYDLDGHRVSVKQKGNWNTNDWNYGLSSYIGYGQISLYAKYDLNPMFKNNPVKQNNISLGIRLDLN